MLIYVAIVYPSFLFNIGKGIIESILVLERLAKLIFNFFQASIEVLQLFIIGLIVLLIVAWIQGAQDDPDESRKDVHGWFSMVKYRIHQQTEAVHNQRED